MRGPAKTTKRRWLLARERACGRLLWVPQQNVMRVLFEARSDESWDHPGRRESFWREVFSGVKTIREGDRDWPVLALRMANMADASERKYPGFVEIVFRIDTLRMKHVPKALDLTDPCLLFIFEDGERWQTK